MLRPHTHIHTPTPSFMCSLTLKHVRCTWDIPEKEKTDATFACKAECSLAGETADGRRNSVEWSEPNSTRKGAGLMEVSVRGEWNRSDADQKDAPGYRVPSGAGGLHRAVLYKLTFPESFPALQPGLRHSGDTLGPPDGLFTTWGRGSTVPKRPPWPLGPPQGLPGRRGHAP